MKFDELILTIEKAHHSLLKETYAKINYNYTVRNWVIGCFIFEFEQNGEDRAEYGNKTLINLAKKLVHIKGLSLTNLKLFRQFYLTYPAIGQTLSDQLQDMGLKQIGQTLSDQSESEMITLAEMETIITHLSFSHFIELLRVDDNLKRKFYEIEAIKNAWNVRELSRAIDTFLFERTGLSSNKHAVIEKIKDNVDIPISKLIKSPYLLEFLGLEEKSEYSELDLEKAIIGNLQKFLTELGRGCHILVDLKLGKFDPADAGQMNLYLNYYRKNEMSEGDNPPIGIILCADKNNALVEYTTTGLSHDVFVSKYLVELPSKEALEVFIKNEISDE